MSSSELCVVCRSLNRIPGLVEVLRAAPRCRVRSPSRVVGVRELAAVGRALELVARQRGGNALQRLVQLQRQLLAAELAHQLDLVLDEDDLALADHADAVGHLLGLVDVVRGQDDRHAAVAQRAHQLPHVAPQLDVDAGRRLVEEQDSRLVRQRLGDQQPALHAARQRHDLAVLLSHSDRSFSTFSMCAGLGGFAEESAAERHRAPGRFERVGRQLLRHEPDHRPRGAVVRDDVVAVDEYRALASD